MGAAGLIGKAGVNGSGRGGATGKGAGADTGPGAEAPKATLGTTPAPTSATPANTTPEATSPSGTEPVTAGLGVTVSVEVAELAIKLVAFCAYPDWAAGTFGTKTIPRPSITGCADTTP